MTPNLALGLLPALSLALATGLNLYATVAVLGAGSRLGWIQPLPPELRGLEHGLVIAVAVLFFLVEAVAERVPFVDSVWSGIHIVVKPLAAALLAIPLLGIEGDAARAGIAVAAALVALGVHAGRGIVRASVARTHRPALELLIHLLHAAIAVALLLTFGREPRLTLLLAAAVLVWTAVWGPRYWRATILTVHAQLARMRAVMGRRRWHEPKDLPAELRPLVPPQPLAAAPPRGIRAGLKGVPGVGAYRSGWLVITPDNEQWFLYRTILGPRRVRLPPIRQATMQAGPWLDTLELECETQSCTVFLLKDGPHPELTLADLST